MLLLEGDLSRHVPDEVLGDVQLLHDVLGSVHFPRDGELRGEQVTNLLFNGVLHHYKLYVTVHCVFSSTAKGN